MNRNQALIRLLRNASFFLESSECCHRQIHIDERTPRSLFQDNAHELFSAPFAGLRTYVLKFAVVAVVFLCHRGLCFRFAAAGVAVDMIVGRNYPTAAYDYR